MFFALAHKEKPVFAAIELDEGVGYYVAEYASVPVEPHIPYTYDVFDPEDTIQGLAEKYKINLDDYALVPLEK